MLMTRSEAERRWTMSLLDLAELTLDDLESLKDSPVADEIANIEEPCVFLFNSTD